jgi:hypothetical protein
MGKLLSILAYVIALGFACMALVQQVIASQNIEVFCKVIGG